MANTTQPDIGQLLHRINEGATSSQTSLSDVMRLCLRLGRLLNNKELSEWAKAEAGGYESINNLPDYRIFETSVRGTFFGPFGSGYRNLSIPRALIEEKHRDILFKVYMRQPVGELAQLAVGRTGTNEITIPWSGDTILYYQQKEISQDHVLASAEQVLTTTIIAGTLEVIRARILEFVLAIEKELGLNAMNYHDNKTPETPSPEKIHQIFNTTIHGGDNIALGNQGTTNQYANHIQPGDLQGLKEKLTVLGVPDKLLRELDTALGKDANSQQQPGSHVQGWFGRLAIKVGQGSLQLAGAAATTAVMAEVRRYLGLPPA